MQCFPLLPLWFHVIFFLCNRHKTNKNFVQLCTDFFLISLAVHFETKLSERTEQTAIDLNFRSPLFGAATRSSIFGTTQMRDDCGVKSHCETPSRTAVDDEILMT